MEVRAVSKYIRISPLKARDVTRVIQGQPALEALAQVELMPRRAARFVGKTLQSAISNAENNEADNTDTEDLVVKTAVVEEGPTIKRFRPKARGMVGPVNKRTSHIKVILSDEEPAKKRK